MEYPIGTTFMTGGKFPRECNVIDVFKTYNKQNELVKTQYCATHIFLGQIVTDCNVPAATIARGLIK
jgi:hypothetical protein